MNKEDLIQAIAAAEKENWEDFYHHLDKGHCLSEFRNDFLKFLSKSTLITKIRLLRAGEFIYCHYPHFFPNFLKLYSENVRNDNTQVNRHLNHHLTDILLEAVKNNQWEAVLTLLNLTFFNKQVFFSSLCLSTIKILFNNVNLAFINVSLSSKEQPANLTNYTLLCAILKELFELSIINTLCQMKRPLFLKTLSLLPFPLQQILINRTTLYGIPLYAFKEIEAIIEFSKNPYLVLNQQKASPALQIAAQLLKNHLDVSEILDIELTPNLLSKLPLFFSPPIQAQINANLEKLKNIFEMTLTHCTSIAACEDLYTSLIAIDEKFYKLHKNAHFLELNVATNNLENLTEGLTFNQIIAYQRFFETLIENCSPSLKQKEASVQNLINTVAYRALFNFSHPSTRCALNEIYHGHIRKRQALESNKEEAPILKTLDSNITPYFLNSFSCLKPIADLKEAPEQMVQKRRRFQ